MGTPNAKLEDLVERPAVARAFEPARGAEAQLIERFRAGDREAMAELYRAHHAAVFRFAFHMTANRDAAAEITQETFVWMIRHPARFDAARGELSAFLNGVARMMARRRERITRRWLPFESLRPGQVHAPENGAERALNANALRKAIARLPIRYREALALCDLEGKSYEEAAACLGCALGTVRSRLHRGRELLAQRLLPGKETQR
jgi:RNA polymerase sigma-70 factor (ECF subfamily)